MTSVHISPTWFGGWMCTASTYSICAPFLADHGQEVTSATTSKDDTGLVAGEVYEQIHRLVSNSKTAASQNHSLDRKAARTVVCFPSMQPSPVSSARRGAGDDCRTVVAHQSSAIKSGIASRLKIRETVSDDPCTSQQERTDQYVQLCIALFNQFKRQKTLNAEVPIAA